MENITTTLDRFADTLTAHPATALQLVLPDGSQVPVHFHVTEVARVQKDFVDCGGIVRRTVSCVLQVWVAGDLDHRLDSTKLAKIIQKGKELFDTTAVPLELEYDNGVISQYAVQDAQWSPTGIVLHLGAKHTACLAPDRCGVTLDLLPSCSKPGCC